MSASLKTNLSSAVDTLMVAVRSEIASHHSGESAARLETEIRTEIERVLASKSVFRV